MARTHKHAPAHRAPDQTGRPDWRAVIKSRDTKRELRRAHERNSAPRPQLGAVSLRFVVGAALAICAALTARSLWHSVATMLQTLAVHGGGF